MAYLFMSWSSSAARSSVSVSPQSFSLRISHLWTCLISLRVISFRLIRSFLRWLIDEVLSKVYILTSHIASWIQSLINSFDQLMDSFLYSSIHSFIHSHHKDSLLCWSLFRFIQRFAVLFSHASVHLSFHSSSHEFIILFICSFIHSSICNLSFIIFFTHSNYFYCKRLRAFRQAGLWCWEALFESYMAVITHLENRMDVRCVFIGLCCFFEHCRGGGQLAPSGLSNTRVWRRMTPRGTH